MAPDGNAIMAPNNFAGKLCAATRTLFQTSLLVIGSRLQACDGSEIVAPNLVAGKLFTAINL